MVSITTLGVCCALLLHLVMGYLDIPLEVKRTKNYISYTVPMKINGIDYAISTSLQDNKDFIFSPADKVKAQTKKGKKHKGSQS